MIEEKWKAFSRLFFVRGHVFRESVASMVQVEQQDLARRQSW